MPVGSNLTSWNNLCLIGGTTPVVPTILCGNATFTHHCGSLLVQQLLNLSIQQQSLSRLQHMLNQSWIGSRTQKKLLMEMCSTPDSSSELYLHQFKMFKGGQQIAVVQPRPEGMVRVKPWQKKAYQSATSLRPFQLATSTGNSDWQKDVNQVT